MDPSYWLNSTSPEALGAYGFVGAQYGPGAPGTIGYDQGVAQAASSPWMPQAPDASTTQNALKFLQGVQQPQVPAAQKVGTPALPRPGAGPSIGVQQLLSMLGNQIVSPQEQNLMRLSQAYRRA